MFNPHFKEVFESVERITEMYIGEASEVKLQWFDKKDEEGNLIQSYPYLTILCKG